MIDTLDILRTDDYLEHHGIKGMHWGIRRTPEQLGHIISRKKEKFEPINEGRVGLYVCGPTVYGDPHLGHARPGIT